jgi:hypothetical protein
MFRKQQAPVWIVNSSPAEVLHERTIAARRRANHYPMSESNIRSTWLARHDSRSSIGAGTAGRRLGIGPVIKSAPESLNASLSAGPMKSFDRVSSTRFPSSLAEFIAHAMSSVASSYGLAPAGARLLRAVAGQRQVMAERRLA